MTSGFQTSERLSPRASVAAEVRAELARAQISGSELARLLGQSQPYWSRRLTGKVAFDVDDLGEIATLLKVPITHFFSTAVTSPYPTRLDSNPQPSDLPRDPT